MPECDMKTKYMFARELNLALRSFATERNPVKTTGVIKSLTERKALRIAMLGLTGRNIGNLLRYFIRLLDKSGFVRATLEAVNVFVQLYARKVDRLSARNISLYLDLIERIVGELDFCKWFYELKALKDFLVEQTRNTTAALLLT